MKRDVLPVIQYIAASEDSFLFKGSLIYIGTSDKGDRDDLSTKDTCFNPMLIIQCIT